ncbi:exonuclease SbcCD subunit D C-terminal domain-containing protein [Acinetobacter sp.]|uniref:exonuclease SbcCD subunit D n=1 Tax=Acinetobacter sp. TaxID=472 RepID=UPI0031DBD3E2
MAVHFFHTSDWHLGQFFYHHSRQYEHQQFLAWLIQQIQEKQPHALLIAGDIFDVINPASSAQKQLYQFLADAHEAAPHMQTLMIAGNHDSGYRIEQVEPLLEKYNAKAVGLIHWKDDQTLDIDRLLTPIFDAEHNIVAWCLTLPFLRPAEITGFNEQTQDSQSAIEYLHQQLIKEAKARKTPEQALILMSHAHLLGAEESDSERPIIIGHQEALSTQLFGDDIDYVALGHLHKPQQIQKPNIRYSGAPIPLSFSETQYKHQVVDVHLDPTAPPDQQFQFEPLIIPRSINLHRLTGELQEIFQKIQQLATGEITDIEQRDYVDIEYFSLTPPPLDLRQQIEQALPANRYRLVRIVRKMLQQEGDQLIESKIDLEPPTPEKLFQQLWQNMGYTPDTEVERDFLLLLEEAQNIETPHAEG